MELKWLAELNTRTLRFLGTTGVVAIVLSIWGPERIRPNLRNSITDTPVSDWVLLILNLLLAAASTAILIGMLRGLKAAFDLASRIEDERNSAQVVVPTPSQLPDPDFELFASMDDAERRALALFITNGVQRIDAENLHRFGHDIPSALQRLSARNFVEFRVDRYAFDDGEWWLIRKHFEKLSQYPHWIGLSIAPRSFG